MKRLVMVLGILGIVAGYVSADRVLVEAGVGQADGECYISKPAS